MNNLSFPYKADHRLIAGIIQPETSVLDLGCGDGDLLALLKKERGVNRAQGIELDEKAIHKCVAKGLSVFQGDIDSGLAEYEDNSFDYVILNQTFQQVKKPDIVLSEALRVGRHVVVGFPNFAHISARYQLAVLGRAPITNSLPYEWYNTPNIHFLSIADFITFCHKSKIKIEKALFLGKDRPVSLFPNLRALLGIFLITKENS